MTRAAGRDGMSTKTGARRPGRRRRCTRCDGWLARPTPGAGFGRGSGLVGLKDRVEALGGRVSLQSPAGAGTTLQIALPFDGPIGQR